MIEKMLEIPKDMKRANAFKLCVLLGLTALLYIMIAHEFTRAAVIMTSQQVSR